MVTKMALDNIIIFEDDFASHDHDFHAVTTIQICELAEEGWFDLSDPSWDFGPKYSEEQHTKLCQRITQHFWWREICVTPPGIWKQMFLNRMNEIMPKFMQLYAMLDPESDFYQPLGQEGEYYKSRNIFSDFPDHGSKRSQNKQNINQDFYQRAGYITDLFANNQNITNIGNTC
jgi:hypothetical protein